MGFGIYAFFFFFLVKLVFLSFMIKPSSGKLFCLPRGSASNVFVQCSAIQWLAFLWNPGSLSLSNFDLDLLFYSSLSCSISISLASLLLRVGPCPTRKPSQVSFESDWHSYTPCPSGLLTAGTSTDPCWRGQTSSVSCSSAISQLWFSLRLYWLFGGLSRTFDLLMAPSSSPHTGL